MFDFHRYRLSAVRRVPTGFAHRFHVPCLDAWVYCVWPRLSEFSGVVLSCFTLSLSTGFTDVSLMKPED